MAPSPNRSGLQLRSSFDEICEELFWLAEQGESAIDFNNGKIISDQHANKMRIMHDASAGDNFWKSRVEGAKLDETLSGHEEMIEEIETGLTHPDTHTMGDAYPFSLVYCDFLYFCIARAALHNPVLDGPEDPPIFEQIQ